MKASGFFGNWAKYSMEKREMNLENRIDWAVNNPELYQKEQLIALLRDVKERFVEKKGPYDPIYDESGFQIGTAAPIQDNQDKIPSRHYYTCRGESIYELEEKVNKLVKVGYQPAGGLSIYEGKFYQAVFLDVPTAKLGLPVDNKQTPTYDKNYLHF